MKEIEITLHPKKTSIILFSIAVFICGLSLAVWYLPRRFQFSVGKLSQLTFVDNEMNIPTYFSVLLLLGCACLLFIIAKAIKINRGRFYRHWMGLSLGFFFMSCDEFMLLHEKLMRPINQLLHPGRFGQIFTFSWIIPGIALVLVLAFIYIKFILALPSNTRWTFFIAAIIYLVGVIGMEMVAGYIKKNFGMESREFVIEATIEEGLEYSGVILFIYGLLEYIIAQFGEITLRISGRQNKAVRN